MGIERRFESRLWFLIFNARQRKYINKTGRLTSFLIKWSTLLAQGIGIKGREMALVWHEKASRTLCRQVRYYTRTLFWYRHTHMTTVKESAEQCRQL